MPEDDGVVLSEDEEGLSPRPSRPQPKTPAVPERLDFTRYVAVIRLDNQSSPDNMIDPGNAFRDPIASDYLKKINK